MSSAWSLESLLTAIVHERDDENTEAIALGGSFARGTATEYSDIDIAHFVNVLPEHNRKQYTYRDGRMVNCSMKSLALEQVALHQPERAIFLVPGFRDMRILLDRQGTLARFVQEVQAFDWAPLLSAADAHASYAMMIEAESPYKILTALRQENHAALAYETMGLFLALTHIMAVQRGVLVLSNNSYMQQVEHSIGQLSSWARYHRLAAGVEEIASDWPPLITRGLATLHVFVESVKLLHAVLLPTHREVVETTADVVSDVLAMHYLLRLPQL